MKKIATLATILTLLCFYGHAQRLVDLDLTHSNLGLTNGQIVYAGQAFNVSISVGNDGPDSVKVADTIALYQLIDNDTVFTAVNNQLGLYRPYTGIPIPNGNAYAIQFPMYFDTSFAGMTVNLCWAIGIRPNTADTVVDPITSNNTTCVTVKVAKAPSAVPGISKTTGVQVYPNPARDVINFRLSGQGNTKLLLMNAVGQVVYRNEQATGGLIQVSTASLAQGMYYYSISTDAAAPVTGRVAIEQ